MPRSRTRNTTSLVFKAAELAFAVPQVVAHRMTRMAIAGPVLSARDRKEFALMGAEKTAAFSASWDAMAMHAIRANQALASSLLRSMLASPLDPAATAQKVAAALHDASADMLHRGLGPLHRTAVANAKRLARTKLR